mmetsp:Transcript_1012/g.1543  ORF Transcript_1012/g.1543 Transcript_1012/m.1543 type:complete len:275 (+) Transcript_1012:2299-3123(+)
MRVVIPTVSLPRRNPYWSEGSKPSSSTCAVRLSFKTFSKTLQNTEVSAIGLRSVALCTSDPLGIGKRQASRHGFTHTPAAKRRSYSLARYSTAKEGSCLSSSFRTPSIPPADPLFSDLKTAATEASLNILGTSSHPPRSKSSRSSPMLLFICSWKDSKHKTRFPISSGPMKDGTDTDPLLLRKSAYICLGSAKLSQKLLQELDLAPCSIFRIFLFSSAIALLLRRVDWILSWPTRVSFFDIASLNFSFHQYGVDLVAILIVFLGTAASRASFTS